MTYKTMPVLQHLPRLVKYLGCHDYGEESEALCPHCGAQGRYVHSALTEAGTEIGAMAGCIKMFPKSIVFNDSMRLFEKRDKYTRKGWKLNRHDEDAIYAISQIGVNGFTVEQAMVYVNRAKAINTRKYR